LTYGSHCQSVSGTFFSLLFSFLCLASRLRSARPRHAASPLRPATSSTPLRATTMNDLQAIQRLWAKQNIIQYRCTPPRQQRPRKSRRRATKHQDDESTVRSMAAQRRMITWSATPTQGFFYRSLDLYRRAAVMVETDYTAVYC
jgi:hypothetical protein